MPSKRKVESEQIETQPENSVANKKTKLEDDISQLKDSEVLLLIGKRATDEV